MTDVLRMGDVVQLREDDAASPVGTLFGYFARFNEPTEINNPMEGHFVERLAPGAFKRTLAEHGRSVKVLFNHGLDPSVGQRPLGVPSMIREDNEGVYAEVPLDDTSYNRDLAASLRSGALSGQSFRFRPVADEWSKKGPSGLPEVTRTEVALREFGPVTFPAYSTATAGIRSGDLLLPTAGGGITVREFLTVEPAALFPELRAGKVLSSENEALVRKALEALHALLDVASPLGNPMPNEARSGENPEEDVDRSTEPVEPAADPEGDEPTRAELMLALTKMRRAAAI